jgi:hypothetical protein
VNGYLPCRAGRSEPASDGPLGSRTAPCTGGDTRTVNTRTSRLGAAELVWDPDTRQGTLRFVDRAGHAGGPEAEQLTRDLAGYLADGPPDEPFTLLVDCTEIRAIDAAWRQVWADFFIAHRDRARLAWFNATPEIKLIITMFRKGTGVEGAAFEDEADAQAYLADAAP